MTSDLMVAFHGDHLEQVFDTERSEGEHLDLGSAVDPDYAIFGLHADGEIMKPFYGFAQLGGDPVDGLDGMHLVQLHDYAAAAMCRIFQFQGSSSGRRERGMSVSGGAASPAFSLTA